MKIVITIDSDEVLKTVKRIALVLVGIAVVLFLYLSSLVFKYSQENTIEYELKYSMLSPSGKAVATSMQKTGEVEDSVLTNKRAFRNTKEGKSNAFFDSVSRRHKKKE